MYNDWRDHVPTEVASSRLVCDKKTFTLPPIVMDPAQQGLILQQASTIDLNRWFRVYIMPGAINCSGGVVTFGAPPQLRFHLLPNGNGILLDALESIAFIQGGLTLKLMRLGTMPFVIG